MDNCLLGKLTGTDCGIGTGIFLLFILFVVVISMYHKGLWWRSNCECVMANISSTEYKDGMRMVIELFTQKSRRDINISHTADREYIEGVPKENGIIYNFRTKDRNHKDKDIEVDYLGSNVDKWPKPIIDDTGDLIIDDKYNQIRKGSISVLSNKRRLATKVIDR